MPIGSPQWMYASGADFTLDQSLRFSNHLGRKTNLSWTPGTPTNQKIWTLSFWIKSGVDGTGNNYMLSAGTSGTQNDTIQFRATGEIDFGSYSSGYTHQLRTTAQYRDPSAWYHYLIAFDTTQGTEANRIKIYVNGVHQTSLVIANYPSQNATAGHVNAAELHNIGKSVWHDGGYLSGYLAEYHFIDGQALTPTSFGETGDYGEWKPIEVDVTYGNNGFYLPFKQDYTVEGFSTVTYRGNSGTQYIGGAGFSPDMTWYKCRSNASTFHYIFDTVRGANKAIYPDQTSAEDANWPSYNTQSFDPDGSTIVRSNGDHLNLDGRTYVAWNWDMGSKTDTKTIAGVSGGVTTTSEQKFGTASLSMQGGSNSRHYKIDDHPDWDFGSGDFTIELWIHQQSNPSAYDGIISFADSSATSAGFGIGYNSSGHIYFASHLGNALSVVAHDAVLSNSTWHHIAVSRSSGTTKLFINGTEEDSATDNNHYITTPNGGYGISIGRYYPNVDEKYFHGEFDEIRISNSARYTGNFSVATSAYATDDNTKLLMHCDGSHAGTVFKDHSASTPNTNGSITSDVAANTTYGQSIVSYKGISTAGTTIGHGLSSAPEMIIVKRRDAGSNHSWPVYHKDVLDGSSQRILRLDTTAAQFNDDTFHYTTPSNTTFSVGSSWGTNLPVGDNFIAYCFHSVTGYSKIGSYTGTGSSGKSITTGFPVGFVIIKKTNAVGDWTMHDNVRGGDNRIYANESDAEGTGYEVQFDSNGFTLLNGVGNWNNSGDTYIYMAFADTREYAYWLDQSGNNNDWTSNNLTESDVMVDSPTNNFATQNPLHVLAAGDPTFSEGNLRIMTALTPAGRNVSTMGFTSGKYYAEMLHEAGVSGSWVAPRTVVGITTNAVDTIRGRDGGNIGTLSSSEDVGYFGDGGVKNIAGTYSAYGSGWTIGDIIGVALNMDNDEVTFYKNNVSQGALSFTAGGEGHFACGDSSAGGGLTAVWNYGQDSSFAGNKTAQGNQDSNGIGDFYYTPPTGFLALCTKNLPDVAVIPSEHFNTVLYTGTGSSNARTGIGFQPDFVWIKDREHTESHRLFDSVRGVQNNLTSIGTNIEWTDANSLTAFGSDGFTVGSENAVNGVAGHSFVAWNWKANGSGSSNTNGSINTTATSANVDAGFSISTYTGNSTSGATVGHGLSKAPELILIKKRSAAAAWGVYNKTDGNTKVSHLDLTAPSYASSGIWNNTTPSTSVFTLGNNALVNSASTTYVAYCFHSVDGYSKVGSYTGNGNADGTFVYTGFRPAFILYKATDNYTHWAIHNTESNPYNVADTELHANESAAEASAAEYKIDFLSNGFKQRNTNGTNNGNGYNYIYIAFAESPFKYSNAR
jgi:hypothetical protein